jgi:hypothetical protein
MTEPDEAIRLAGAKLAAHFREDFTLRETLCVLSATLADMFLWMDPGDTLEAIAMWRAFFDQIEAHLRKTAH